MKNEFLSPSQDLPTLTRNVGDLLNELKIANITNLEVLQKADLALDILSCLDIEGHLLPCLGWEIDSASAHALRQIANNVVENAKEAKFFLRKAALKSYSTRQAGSFWINKISIILVNINLSLLQLTSELYGLKNLPLFSFAHKISE